MKRRGKMLSRVVLWTVGVLLGALIKKWTGGIPDAAFYFGFWSGMMLAATFIHFDPPEVERWEQSR
jgi:hypothetical protein